MSFVKNRLTKPPPDRKEVQKKWALDIAEKLRNADQTENGSLKNIIYGAILKK